MELDLMINVSPTGIITSISKDSQRNILSLSLVIYMFRSVR